MMIRDSIKSLGISYKWLHQRKVFSVINFSILSVPSSRGLISVYKMPVIPHILLDAQNSLIVGMEKLENINIMQVGIIGRAMLLQVLVLLKMVFVMVMVSFLKLSTLPHILNCLLDISIHHFGDFR